MNIKKIFIFGILFCFVSIFILLKQLPDDRFHLYFLDVGQGDSTLIKTPLNHYILIDGGPENLVIEELGRIMPFFHKTIDLVVLTHPHADHIDGLVEVLKRFTVENVLISGIYSSEPAYLEFLKEIDKQDITLFIADSDEDFLFGDLLVDVLYPIESFYGKSFNNINNSSVVALLSYKKVSVLLTGDLEIEGEYELVNSGLLEKVDIYQAGHHGSKTASGLELLAEISPDIAVISCGLDNKFNHPHKEVLTNFKLIGIDQIYRTDNYGTVEFAF